MNSAPNDHIHHVISAALATVHPTWRPILEPVRPTIERCLEGATAATTPERRVLPDPDQVLRAFSTPFDQVKVLLIGQDPYPTVGHPIGLCFAVERSVRPIPRSLSNIYQELHADVGIPPAEHGDLSAWSAQGVLLLNRVLTVTAGASGSHAKRGWEQVTDCAVQALAARGGPLVALLWGRQAQSVTPLLGQVPVVASTHPSPLSASRGFFGSRPFSQVNQLLVDQGGQPVDWTVR